ncbi:MAG: YdaU family protein [Pseudomonadota bacterium]
MHYYKKDIGKYAKKTGGLSMLEHGAYTLLMDAYYDRERAPTKQEAIEWCWARTKQEIAAVEFVLSRFFTIDGDVYKQQTAEEILSEYQSNCLINKKIAIDRENRKRTNRAQVVNEQITNEHLITNQKLEITNQKLKNKDISGKQVASVDVLSVFDYWKITMNHEKAKLDHKREKAIKLRLKDGYSVSDMCAAVDGCKRSPYHMGKNDQATVYDDIELICRNATNVDKFLKLASLPDRSNMSDLARHNIQAAESWLSTQDLTDA